MLETPTKALTHTKMWDYCGIGPCIDVCIPVMQCICVSCTQTVFLLYACTCAHVHCVVNKCVVGGFYQSLFFCIRLLIGELLWVLAGFSHQIHVTCWQRWEYLPKMSTSRRRSSSTYVPSEYATDSRVVSRLNTRAFHLQPSWRVGEMDLPLRAIPDRITGLVQKEGEVRVNTSIHAMDDQADDIRLCSQTKTARTMGRSRTNSINTSSSVATWYSNGCVSTEDDRKKANQ